MALEDLLMEQRSCPRCNICKWVPIENYVRAETQAACPAIEKYQFHSYSAGGKQHMCIGLTEGRIELDESVMNIAYKCHFCGACEFSCKVYRTDMDLSDTFDELRIACVEADKIPDAHRVMMDNLAANGDCYGHTVDQRIDWTQGTGIKTLAAGQTGEVFLYAGTAALYDAKLAEKTAAVAKLLMSHGIDLVTAGVEEANSGYEAFVLGHIEKATATAAKVQAQVEASGASTILVMDAHGFGTMRNYYPKHFVELGVEIKHVTELLAELVAAGEITFTKQCDKTVTYQDPCYLGRRSDPYKPPFFGMKDTRPLAETRSGQLGIYDAPRALIQAVPGVKLVEMDRIKGYAWCCGGGAGVEQAYPELTKSTSETRINEAKLTGADIIITACSNCEHVLGDAGGMQVMDILDLLLNEGGAQ